MQTQRSNHWTTLPPCHENELNISEKKLENKRFTFVKQKLSLKAQIWRFHVVIIQSSEIIYKYITKFVPRARAARFVPKIVPHVQHDFPLLKKNGRLGVVFYMGA